MWHLLVSSVIFISILLFVSQETFGTENKTWASTILEKFQQHDYKMKFERYEVVSYNKRFLSKFEAVTFKYNRSLAVVNVSWVYITDIGNEFEIVVQGYKFASNEYRLAPARFEINFCDGYKKNIIGIRNTIRCGNFTGCPMITNAPVTICNWSPDESLFPPMVPDGDYMLEMEGMLRSVQLFVVRSYGTVYRPIFKQHDYKLEFERIELVSFNKQYVRRFDVVTFKYNRTSAVINATWINTVDIKDNLDLVIQAYKFASNEYRLFPIRFSLNFCDAYQKNLIGAQTTKRCGNLAGCPILKNVTIRVCNWSPDPSQFPPMIPNGRYMVEFQAMFRSIEMFVGRGYAMEEDTKEALPVEESNTMKRWKKEQTDYHE
ncbi:hypothetical protein ILUMI_00823 [Ignelater luminosus]|uniref:Uncharacterized protein n=1 Tax=Ignelater luminosus TaxID=2038154 RepID=A0A8K0GPU5_IGNLU|nr:hypothetical protein ILUMI_00823 [Ignelater luminosus]